MIVESSGIKMESTHTLEERRKSLVIRRAITPRPVGEINAPPRKDTAGPRKIVSGTDPMEGIRVTLSRSAGLQYSRQSSDIRSITGVMEEGMIEDEDGNPSSEKRAKLMVLLKTMERITGKSYHVSDIEFQKLPDNAVPITSLELKQAVTAVPSPQQPDGQTVTIEAVQPLTQVETITKHSHYEKENTGFSAAGVVTTADGREIDIDVQLNMSREFYETHVERRVETARLTDPLVITWDGGAADLTEKSYAFDLDSDGVDDQISFVTPGSGGFLAYDRNRDGIINNGGELFGPTRGNGFSELADHDQDGNGWIDEADEIFYDLAIWTKNPDGEDQLIALADAGIGAIYLNAAETPFSVNTEENEKLGQVRSSSIYLNENGTAGVIQQVDLVVKSGNEVPNSHIEAIV